MSLEPGDLLGPYRIQALLGTGAMGEVYRARDRRLGRDAALKVIAPRLLGDPALPRRFEIEARAASVLNHPAISQGAMPLGQVLSIARQIADGLAAAHAKGIVHRDLKPENIMIGVDGRAKILDFGLDRQTIVDAMEISTSNAETPAAMAGTVTFEGAILGTVGYLSPEQAAGRVVDFRADQQPQ